MKVIPLFLTNLKLAKFVFTDKNVDKYEEISRENAAEDGEDEENALENVDRERRNTAETAYKFIKSGNIELL